MPYNSLLQTELLYKPGACFIATPKFCRCRICADDVVKQSVRRWSSIGLVVKKEVRVLL